LKIKHFHTLGYFTERLDPGPTRLALFSLIRGAKRRVIP
jgi:hypothetical protein